MWTFLALLCLLGAPFIAPIQPGPAPVRSHSLAIQHVTVIDATGKPAQPDMTVVLDRDRIEAVTPSKKATIPKNAQILDGSGKFLIPGLWDMHVHGTETPWSYGLYLANGVVGVRDMWGPEDANAWRAKQATYGKPAPSIYFASPIIDGPRPVMKDMIAVASEAQGREVVDRYKDHGSDFIKVYSLLPRDIYFAIADEAHKRGIPFAGHVPAAVTAAEASDAGQRSMEHLMGVELACSNQEKTLRGEIPRRGLLDLMRRDERALESYDDAKAQPLFARFVKNGTWQCPTLTIERMNAFLDDPQFRSDDRLKYMPKSEREDWDPAQSPWFKAATPEDWAAFRIKFQEDLKLVGRMHRAGVGIIAGTDVLNPYCFPGFSLHDELALLVEAGLSPMEALQASTKEAARFMGQLDQRGTIEPGKIADLVLLDHDPLADIHNSRSIRAVVLGGRLMPRATLDTMLTQAESSASK
jgi:imidazolonepropionase-like amidohydrolase